MVASVGMLVHSKISRITGLVAPSTHFSGKGVNQDFAQGHSSCAKQFDGALVKMRVFSTGND